MMHEGGAPTDLEAGSRPLSKLNDPYLDLLKKMPHAVHLPGPILSPTASAFARESSNRMGILSYICCDVGAQRPQTLSTR
jgi:hypothetical protein